MNDTKDFSIAKKKKLLKDLGDISKIMRKNHQSEILGPETLLFKNKH